jgi:sn-glycerol 3-phosphate transport system substrate-binding protein
MKMENAMIARRTLLAAATATLAVPNILRAQAATKLTFYYPIAIGGPIPAIIDGYCRDFQKASGIEVSPVFAGVYGETLTKAVAALKAGQGPQLAILLAAEIHSLQDMDILLSIDELAGPETTKTCADTFFPAFLANSRLDGKTWSIPFQRSTAVDYYNKTAFTDAGLDPEKFPTTWDGLANVAEKLTKRDATGRVTQWGVKLASDLGNAQWTFGALAWQANHILMNEAGTEVYFDHPKSIEAMAFWRSLAFDRRAMPEGITSWGALPQDLFSGNTAIVQSTTGNLTNVRDKARFPFGVAGLPGEEAPRAVVGGGNMYFFKATPQPEREAALKFAQFLIAPERAADWCMKTGYIATSPAAWQTPELKAYVEKFPAAGVAKDFLPTATGELSTYENQRIQKALTDQIQACLSGKKTPSQAMADAQAESDRILKPFRRT